MIYLASPSKEHLLSAYRESSTRVAVCSSHKDRQKQPATIPYELAQSAPPYEHIASQSPNIFESSGQAEAASHIPLILAVSSKSIYNSRQSASPKTRSNRASVHPGLNHAVSITDLNHQSTTRVGDGHRSPLKTDWRRNVSTYNHQSTTRVGDGRGKSMRGPDDMEKKNEDPINAPTPVLMIRMLR